MNPCHSPLSIGPGSQRGIALVMVLWLLVLMTVISSSHSRNIRTETRLASNHVEYGKARNLAEGGVYHAIMELLVNDDNKRWPVDGSIRRVELPQGTLDVAIRSASGLVDINAASSGVLDALLTGAGLEDDRDRRAIVDAILDWRDGDDLKHIHGAEDDDYRRAGLSWAARDGLFSSVEELRYILGMTNTLFAKLAPYVTVHSGKPGVNPNFAAPWLQQVMREQLGLKASGSPAGNGGSVFHVSVQATTMGNTNASLEAVVKIGRSGKQPYRILSWRSPAPSPAVTPDEKT